MSLDHDTAQAPPASPAAPPSPPPPQLRTALADASPGRVSLLSLPGLPYLTSFSEEHAVPTATAAPIPAVRMAPERSLERGRATMMRIVRAGLVPTQLPSGRVRGREAKARVNAG